MVQVAGRRPGAGGSRSIPMPGNARFEKSKIGWKIIASDLGLVSYGVTAACPLAQNRAFRYRFSTQVLFRKQLKVDLSLPASPTPETATLGHSPDVPVWREGDLTQRERLVRVPQQPSPGL